MKFWNRLKRKKPLDKVRKDHGKMAQQGRERVAAMLQSSKAELHHNRVFVTSKGKSRYVVKSDGVLYKNGEKVLDRDKTPMKISHVVGIPERSAEGKEVRIHDMMVGFYPEIIITAASYHAVEPKAGDSVLFLSDNGKKVGRITSTIDKIE